jgi:hypothetical protein
MSPLQCNPDELIVFLDELSWSIHHLVAFDPTNQKGPRKFRVDLRVEKNRISLKKWVRRMNESGWNIHYHVNELEPDFKKVKASKSNVQRVCCYYVDIDPRSGESSDDCKGRVQARLQNLPAGIPSPTLVVDSGNGIQLIWLLTEPIEIKGQPKLARQAEGYSKMLADWFDGDSCHNVDRLLRAPGTTNWPNEQKKRKGRTVVESRLISHNPSATYSMDDFPVPEQNLPQEAASAPIKISLDEADLSEWDRLVIEQGRHPSGCSDNQDDSRSGWLFRLVISLLKRRISDDVIASIITDSRHAISQSVLEKPNPRDYAMKQVAKAKLYIKDSYVERLNQKHMFIGNYHGKVAVLENVADPETNRAFWMPQSPSDFRERYAHEKVHGGLDSQGNPKLKKLGHAWLDHPAARRYERMVFCPSGDAPEGCYNEWQGFSVKPVPGDWSRFREHLSEVICGGDAAYYEYLIHWMARCVQRPELNGQVAIVLRGGKGCGKSVAVELFGNIFGKHFLPTSAASHVVGKFNSHLRDIVLLFGDEAFFAGNPEHEKILKTLITQDEVSYEKKYGNVENGRNHVSLFLASNSDWVVPSSMDERRYFVLDVSPHRTGDRSYFTSILQQMKNGGLQGMLFDLLQMDLSDFELRNVPETAALIAQKRLSLPPMLNALIEIAADGLSPDHLSRPEVFAPNEITTSGMISYANDQHVVASQARYHGLKGKAGSVLRQYVAKKENGKPDIGRPRANGPGRGGVYRMPPLPELRKQLLEPEEGWSDPALDWQHARPSSRRDHQEPPWGSDVPF